MRHHDLAEQVDRAQDCAPSHIVGGILRQHLFMGPQPVEEELSLGIDSLLFCLQHRQQRTGVGVASPVRLDLILLQRDQPVERLGLLPDRAPMPVQPVAQVVHPDGAVDLLLKGAVVHLDGEVGHPSRRIAEIVQSGGQSV